MTVNFPSSPSQGDTYTYEAITYTFDGEKWVGSTASSFNDVTVSGASANVILQGNDSITTDQTFTFPNNGGALSVAAAAGEMPNLYACAVSTADQSIGSLQTVTFSNNNLRNRDNLLNNGVFTVDSSNVGTYLIIINFYVYSLQNTSGEATLIGKIEKNDTDVLAYQEIWETTNPDETSTGMSLTAVAQLNTSGDYVDLKAHIIGSSGSENLRENSSMTILRLF
ncbi:hypothetical protein [Synechococcus phage MA10]